MQFQVMRKMEDGKDIRGISEEMGITKYAVYVHIYKIKKKLGVLHDNHNDIVKAYRESGERRRRLTDVFVTEADKILGRW